jgi:hypothetical protein
MQWTFLEINRGVFARVKQAGKKPGIFPSVATPKVMLIPQLTSSASVTLDIIPHTKSATFSAMFCIVSIGPHNDGVGVYDPPPPGYDDPRSLHSYRARVQ